MSEPDETRVPTTRTNSSRRIGFRVSLVAVLFCLILASASSARADGIDAYWLLTRVGGWEKNPALSIFLMVGLMAINYALNFVVIGLPANRRSQAGLAVISWQLVGFTLLAQIADRLAALVGMAQGIIISLLLQFVMSGEGVVGWGILFGLGFNFILSGLAVGLLAYRYLTRRWGIPGDRAKEIAFWAGLITNPAWLMGLGLMGYV